MSHLSAIILAGGKSSRMGQDKALLVAQGTPLIRHTYDIAARCSDRPVVVTPWPDRYRPHLPASCRYVTEVALEAIASANGGMGNTAWEHTGLESGSYGGERDKTHGPLVGFYQGLGAIATEWTMLLACDLPRLRAAPLQRWAEHLTTLPEATTAYLPRWSRGWDPLCGFYRRRCHPDLGAFIAGGGRSFQQWLQQQAVAEISEAAQEAEIFYNCNTPQDWQQLHAEQS